MAFAVQVGRHGSGRGGGRRLRGGTALMAPLQREGEKGLDNLSGVATKSSQLLAIERGVGGGERPIDTVRQPRVATLSACGHVPWNQAIFTSLSS